VPRPPKVPPSGFGYPPGGVSPAALGSVFQLPTLLGFALQSLVPTPRPVRGFPRTIRSCAFLPNPSAWHRRFSGLRSRGQLRTQLPGYDNSRGGAPALLSFCVSRVFFRRTLEEAPSFFLPLSFFASRPPKMPETWTPGGSFQRRGFPPFRGALTRMTFPTGCTCRLFETWTGRGLFFQLGVP
jgi:hypothetical protein